VETLHLTGREARRFLLVHQNLWPPRSLAGKPSLLEYIRRVNCVQFDPIDICGRNHELVLQARVRDFTVPMLYEALYDDRALIDGFDKNMCVYRTEDWPYFRRNRDGARRSLEARSHPVVEAAQSVHREIEERGPLSSADLDLEQSVRWPWGPTRLARAALEGMYFWGELVVHHKVGVRKVYDLTERHIPRELLAAAEPNVSDERYHDWHICRRIGSVGLLANRGAEAWLGIEGTSSARRAESLSRAVADGRLREVRVEGVENPLYMRSEDEIEVETALRQDSQCPRAAVIAPLDNLLWDRRLAQQLFGLEYTWEVYVPAAKRRYGYYVLPVLYGDRFVARFEPVRDRKTKTLVVKNWWWEDGVDRRDRAMVSALADCLDAFRTFLGCTSSRIEARDLRL
jgi:uncharacterized protein YcaQ